MEIILTIAGVIVSFVLLYTVVALIAIKYLDKKIRDYYD